MSDDARNQEEEWEIEEGVTSSKPVGVVVSVRVNPDLAERLFAEAERRGLKTSALVREAVDLYLENGMGRPATVDLTISSADAPVTLYTGRSTLGRTISATPASFEHAGA